MDGADADVTVPGEVFALDEAWIYKVTVLADRIARRVGAVVNETSGLNLSQWRVMAAVADRPGRTSSEVVEITPMDKAIVSRAVASLVERGLAERRASPIDGRRAHLFLTEEGERTYGRLVAALAESGADGGRALGPKHAAAFMRQLEKALAAYPA